MGWKCFSTKSICVLLINCLSENDVLQMRKNERDRREEKQFHLQLSCCLSGRAINIQLKREAYQLSYHIYHRSAADDELILNYEAKVDRGNTNNFFMWLT